MIPKVSAVLDRISQPEATQAEPGSVPKRVEVAEAFLDQKTIGWDSSGLLSRKNILTL